MLKDYPLINVLVLCYNNQKYFYENLKSIFEQTYPNIEILIADDASKDFNASDLINWINKNRTPNITKISIFENQFNLGTVANLEMLQKKSTGEYLFNIAADDVLFDKNVLMNLYNKATEVNTKVKIIFAETEMWDEKLQNKIGDFLGKEAIDRIENSTPEELFAEGSWHPFFPACYLYSRNLLGCIGKLSEKYKLVEDWPTILIALRNGIKPCCCNIRSTIKHRHGGVSHGNSINSHKILLAFYRDLYDVYAYEVEPYLHKLSIKEKQRAHKYASDRFRAYYKIQIPKSIDNNTASNSVIYSQNKKEIDNKNKYEIKYLNQTDFLNREYLKNMIYKISTKKSVLITIVIGAIIFISAVLSFLYGNIMFTIFLAALFSIICCIALGEVFIYCYFRNVI